MTTDPPPHRARTAPPPTPPPEVEVAMSAAGKSAGFRPHQGRMLVEVVVGVSAICLLVVLVILGAGRLASWMTPLIPLDVDRTIGAAASKQMAMAPTCEGPAQKYVETLAEPLLRAAGDVPFDFTFRVVDDPSVNAFALPGGYVTVNRGLLEAADSGEEVAGVLGHEIQHALLRHGTRRILRQMGGRLVLAVLLGGTDLEGISVLAGNLASRSHDRDQETEADTRGVELLVAAGIDPRGLARFFERLEARGGAPPELVSTHPDPGRRAERVEQAARGKSFRELPPPPDTICQ